MYCCFVAFAQTSGSFYVNAVIPENQADNRQTYFDLYMEQNQKQTLEIIITNTKSEEITVISELNSASTGRNGLLVYTESDIRDENLKISITDIAKLRDGSITIPAGESVSAYIDINMPEEKIYGTILGGITFTEKENDIESEIDSGVSIKNKITYVIGLKIAESDDTVTPDFELVSITPGLINYKTAVSVKIRNTEPLIVKNMKVNAEIFSIDENDSEALESVQKLSLENSEMAPVSSGDFVIDWENKEFTPGAYRLDMTISYNEREWSWSEGFNIEGKQADEINSGAVDISPDDTLAASSGSMIWIYIITGSAAVAVIIYIGYSLGRKKQVK